jgi:hypothetical protein
VGYHSHRLLVVDETFLNLPDYQSIHEEFGTRYIGRGKNKDLKKSMCLLSMLYDLVNYMTLDTSTTWGQAVAALSISLVRRK